MNISIDLKTYPYILIVSIGDSDKELNRELKKYNISCKESCTLDNQTVGFYIPFSNNISLIRLEKYNKNSLQDLAILQHEILHCTFDILKQVGIKLSDKSEEAFTYLHEFITFEVHTKLKKKWKKKNS